jgi:uncharacterized protein (TIGR03067 family)
VPYRPSRSERPAYRPPSDPATLVIDGHLVVMKHGDKSTRQSLLKLVPGQTVKAVDLMTTVEAEFWLTRAIYKMDGDTLTICESERDRPRPTTFRRWEGGNEELTLLTTFVRQRVPATKTSR